EQGLASLEVPSESITWERWEALGREYAAKSRLDILADIGLGKRLSFVVAQALVRASSRAGGAGEDPIAAPAKPEALQLRGVEGVAIQYGKCCRPIPGDAIFGQFRRGQGLLVHTRERQTLKKSRVDSDQIVDVEWAPDIQGVFEAGIRRLVAGERGLLARVAPGISDAGASSPCMS